MQPIRKPAAPLESRASRTHAREGRDQKNPELAPTVQKFLPEVSANRGLPAGAEDEAQRGGPHDRPARTPKPMRENLILSRNPEAFLERAHREKGDPGEQVALQLREADRRQVRFTGVWNVVPNRRERDLCRAHFRQDEDWLAAQAPMAVLFHEGDGVLDSALAEDLAVLLQDEDEGACRIPQAVVQRSRQTEIPLMRDRLPPNVVPSELIDHALDRLRPGVVDREDFEVGVGLTRHGGQATPQDRPWRVDGN